MKALFFLISLALALCAQAQPYPSKPIHVVVPSPPGGPPDLIKSMSGTDILSVQYRGVAEVMTDVLAGRIDMFFVGTQIAASQAQAGKVRVLALTGAKRWKGLPNVPTMEEAGFKGFNLINWFGIWLPAGAPGQLGARIPPETVKGLARPELQRQVDA